jgi:hypothetical protein
VHVATVVEECAVGSSLLRLIDQDVTSWVVTALRFGYQCCTRDERRRQWTYVTSSSMHENFADFICREATLMGQAEYSSWHGTPSFIQSLMRSGMISL